jgi:pimeloyl-ACP methyl ester carboxylesterase
MPLRERYTIFAVEKFNREAGRYYGDDPEEMARYHNWDLLLDNWYSVIVEYLEQNDFESVVLIGHSLGGVMLPRIYARLKNRGIAVTTLISNGAGGAYNLISDFSDITTPFLFLHGELDRNVSVRHTRRIQQWLPNNPFTFIFYEDMAHGPSATLIMIRWRTDIINWLAEVDP